MLNSKDVAKLLNMSLHTFITYKKKLNIKPIDKIGNINLYLEKDVDKIRKCFDNNMHGKYIRTKEHRQLMRNLLKNRVFNPKTIEKMSNAKKGITYVEKFGIERSEKIREKISKNGLGIKRGPMSQKHKDKLSKAAVERYKDITKHPAWKGGITSEYLKIRNSDDYKKWRTSVFERDNYTCQITGEPGPNLIVHHIENFSSKKEKRMDINNGITMKERIHIVFHRIYGKINNNKEEIEDFKDTIKKMGVCTI